VIAPLPTDEMDIARRRMKHLEPWRIVPVPAVRAAARTYRALPLTQEARDRFKVVALNVLALHMATAHEAQEPSPITGLG
jgi:hypothetical protein